MIRRYGVLCTVKIGTNSTFYRGKAEIIIAKHRKGATDIALLNFRGEYTRFENPEDNSFNRQAPFGGEIREPNIKGNVIIEGYNPFNVSVNPPF